VIVLVIGFVPRFETLFKKLEEKGELPQLTGWLMAFRQLDAACFHLLVVLLAITPLAVDEAAVRLFHRRARGNLWSWLCVGALGLAGAVAQVMIVVGLLLPVYRMGHAIR
jgi:hypothetical protein